MSILNAWVGEQRALVGVDTEIINVERKVGEVAKMIPLAHMNAVLAARGHILYLSALFTTLHLCGGDYDVVANAMPGVVELVRGGCLADPRLAQAGVQPSDLDTLSVVLVGWSPARRRMLGLELERANGTWTSGELNPSHSAPWDASLPTRVDLSNRVAMTQYAKLQTSLLHEKVPHASAGGRFIVATMESGGSMRIEDCGRLPARLPDAVGTH